MIRIPVFSLLLLLCACQPQQKSTVEELFEVDKEFSKRSVEEGYAKAFTEFAHNEAVLLRDNQWPLKGKDSLKKMFESLDTDGISLTWEPLEGNIAKSGELGYTYGTFELKTDSLVQKGTYVSVWKKDEKGDWKYILDSGNQGLGD